MNKKTKKAGATVGSVSPVNPTTKEQITTSHTEESSMNEKKIDTAKETEENSVPVSTTEQETSDGTVPCFETPETTPSVEPGKGQFRSDLSQLISSTRNLFGDKDEKALFAADRQFMTSLLTEYTYRRATNQDDFFLKLKDEFYEKTFKKLEQANPEELYEDVCQILDISHDFVPTDYKSNAPMHFDNKISDIFDKYNISDYNFPDPVQLNKTLMLQINKNNLSEE